MPDADLEAKAERGRTLWFGALIALAVLLAYAGTFSAPFVLDSEPIATAYPSIRHLWPIWKALAPPHDGSTVEGRPILNFSLALSYALSGTGVVGYHAVNLAIHLVAALVLFGLARRTLRLAGVRQPELIGFAIGLIWAVHPLDTEAVTYVIQRAESQMGLFYLLTLYCFVRALPSGRPGWWFSLSWLCCLLGMGTKEVMVSAPVMVFLYDRTFVTGGCRETWRRRRGYYLCLAATWLLLAGLAASSGSRSGTAGFATAIPWPDYALTQLYGLVRYLRLALWPHPLVFDYGALVVRRASVLIPDGLVVAALAAAAIAGLRSRAPAGRAAGFLGAWYFAILAPTSLIPVATQTLAEHRMYLALVPVAAAVVLVAKRTCGRRTGVFLALTGLAGAALLAATARRNQTYASPLALWSDMVRHMPANTRAWINLGNALRDSGRMAESVAAYREAIRIEPNSAEAHHNLGVAWFKLGRSGEAMAEFQTALRLRPDYAHAHYNFGVALYHLGRTDEAIAQYEAAVRLDPGFLDAQSNLAIELFRAHRLPEALEHFQAVLKLDPGDAQAHLRLAVVLRLLGRTREADAQYLDGLRLEKPMAEPSPGLSR